MFYFIEPEVGGGFGANTVVDTTAHPPVVSKLHYLFDGWLGDHLLEVFPCYIATEELAKMLEKEMLSGFSLHHVDVSKSEQFRELYPDMALPKFYWLKIDGIAGENDFGIAKDNRLVVSEKALNTLRTRQLEQADLEDY